MNKHEKPHYNLDTSSFELPFMSDFYASDADEDAPGWHHADIFEKMDRVVPSDAIFIGQVDCEIDGMAMTCKIESHYYCIPWAGDDYDWALFAINWDDNWGKYEWESLRRIKGEKDRSVAARTMFADLLSSWGYDRESEYGPFYELLDEL